MKERRRGEREMGVLGRIEDGRIETRRFDGVDRCKCLEEEPKRRRGRGRRRREEGEKKGEQDAVWSMHMSFVSG